MLLDIDFNKVINFVAHDYPVAWINGRETPLVRCGENLFFTEKNYFVIELDDKYDYLHRLIAERILGRKLKRGENVHHIDGNKLDNRPANLLICTEDYHYDLHKRCLAKFKSWNIPSKMKCPVGVKTSVWKWYLKRENKLRRARQH